MFKNENMKTEKEGLVTEFHHCSFISSEDSQTLLIKLGESSFYFSKVKTEFYCTWECM